MKTLLRWLNEPLSEVVGEFGYVEIIKPRWKWMLMSRAIWMLLILLLWVIAFALSGCSGIPVERTYSVEYRSGETTLKTGVTLKPARATGPATEGFAK